MPSSFPFTPHIPQWLGFTLIALSILFYGVPIVARLNPGEPSRPGGHSSARVDPARPAAVAVAAWVLFLCSKIAGPHAPSTLLLVDVSLLALAGASVMHVVQLRHQNRIKQRALAHECVTCGYAQHPGSPSICSECGQSPSHLPRPPCMSAIQAIVRLMRTLLVAFVLSLLIPVFYLGDCGGTGSAPWSGTRSGRVDVQSTEVMALNGLGMRLPWSSRLTQFVTGHDESVISAYDIVSGNEQVRLYGTTKVFYTTGQRRTASHERDSVFQLIRETVPWATDADAKAITAQLIHFRKLVWGIWGPASEPTRWTTVGFMGFAAQIALGYVIVLGMSRWHARSQSRRPMETHPHPSSRDE